MRYRFLGKTGVVVSELCLGAMTFGGDTDEETSVRMLDRFVEVGGNFIDTANGYTETRSEQILGRWLKGQDRDGLVVATKVRWGAGRNAEGLSRKHVMGALDASLRRLGTGYVDLYQIHGWDQTVRVEQVVRIFDELVRSGKVRYVGVSNWAAWRIQQALDAAAVRDLEPFACLQPRYNLLDREAEWELIPQAVEAGMGVIPWGPLRGGWLSGKYRRGMTEAPPNTRIAEAEKYPNWSERWSNYANDRTWTVVDELLRVADQLGRPPSAVALNWLLQRPGVTAPIIGARTLDHLESNLSATDWDLDQDSLTALTRASDLPMLPYPHDVLTFSDRTPQ